MADIVYRIKIKDGKTREDVLNEFGRLGYDLFPQTLDIFKIIPQDWDSEPCQLLLSKYYLNSNWKELVYEPNKKILKKKLSLTYDKNGNIKQSKTFKKMVQSWRIEICNQDGDWLGFTSLDPYDKNVFYGKSILDKYCYDEIQKLKERDLIEEFVVLS